MKTLKTLKHIALLVGMLLMSLVSEGQSTVTCYPPNQTYATGYTNGSTKYSGEMQTISNGGVQGWMMFDVSSIPNNATINSIELHFYSTSTSTAWVKLTAANELNPTTASASSLYSAITTETPNYYTSTYISGLSSAGWKTFTLSSAAISNLQNNGLSNDYFTIGFYEYETGSYYLYAEGYNSSNKPYIIVTYTAAPPHTLTGTIQCGQTVSGTLGTSGGTWGTGSSPYNMNSGWGVGAEAVYAFTPQITGTHIIAFNTTSGDPDFWVLSENNSQTAIYATSGGNQSAELTAGHTYYLVADNYYSTSTSGYSIQITCPQIYTVTYNANGGSGTMNPQEFVSNVPQVLTSNTFTKPGYSFAGWNTSADGSGTSYGDGQSITVNSDITLYAQWNCLPPSNVQVAEQTENYLITWDGEAQSYTVYVYMVTKYENVTGNELEVLLYPGENYYVRVESICGESASSNEFTTSGTPLPIKLTSFTATPYYTNYKKWEYNLIQWSTATETNNDYFILESSSDAVNFKEIAKIAGAGSSMEQLDYDFKDYQPVSDITYYRLTQVDYDGSKTLSEIIGCRRIPDEKSSNNIEIYPNPTKGIFTVVNAEGKDIVVINSLGQVIATIENSSSRQIINIGNHPSGVYFIKVDDEVIKINVIR